jgi:hypothetical protein
MLASTCRDRRQSTLAKRAVAVLADQLLNRRQHDGWLGRGGALGAQIIKQRPHARSRQAPAIAPIFGEETAHRVGSEVIHRERLALQPPSQMP